jgi:hypothetical protein
MRDCIVIDVVGSEGHQLLRYYFERPVLFQTSLLVGHAETSIVTEETGIGIARVDRVRETEPIMTRLVQATTVTFLHPDPNGPIHEYDSIRCTPGRPGTETVIIEVPKTETDSNSEQGRQHSRPVANGWEALVSNADGEVLVDGYVIRTHHSRSASVYTLHR